MKYIFVSFCAAVALLFTACTKTTNNTSIVPAPQAYTVDGVHDVTLDNTNYSNNAISMPITLSYHDSSQQTVTVALSGMTSVVDYFVGAAVGTTGFTDSGPWTGVTPFTIPLYVGVNHVTSYVTGTVPMMLTCTAASGGTKVIKFNMIFQ